jgi:WD40 repeat protein
MSLARRDWLIGAALGASIASLPAWTTAETPEAAQALRVLQARPAPGHREPPVITSVVLQPGGKLLAVGGDDHVLRIWDVASGELRHELAGHRDWIRAIAFLPDGQRLITAGNDRRLLEWTISDGGVVHRQLALAPQAISDVAIGVEAKQFVAAGFNKTLCLFDAASGQTEKKLDCPCRDMRCVSFAPDGLQMAAAGRNGKIRFWTAVDAEPTRTVKGHTQRIRALAFSPDGARLASAGEDRVARIWDVATGQMDIELPTPGAKVMSLAYIDRERIATGGTDNKIRLWDLVTRRELAVLEGHTGTVATLDAQNGVLVSGSYDTTVRIWSIDAAQGTLAKLRVGRISNPSEKKEHENK